MIYQIKQKFLFALVTTMVAFTFPISVSASNTCSTDGYTVATINGVFTDKQGALNNKDALEKKIGKTFNNEPVEITFFHNPSHLAGIGDATKSAYQKVFESDVVEDYDLIEILIDASEKVQTQKLLLVAHSQGNFYANSFYDTVTQRTLDVPEQSISVFSVATPANHVAGDGLWLTSDTDAIIAGFVANVPFKSIMPPNVHIELQEGDQMLGHKFAEIYLKYEGPRIIENIETSLLGLSSYADYDIPNPCIFPPKRGIIHNTKAFSFMVADPVAEMTKDSAIYTAHTAYTTGKFAVNKTVQVADATAKAGMWAAEKTANSIVYTADTAVHGAVWAYNKGTRLAKGTYNTGKKIVYFGTSLFTTEETSPTNSVETAVKKETPKEQTAAGALSVKTTTPVQPTQPPSSIDITL